MCWVVGSASAEDVAAGIKEVGVFVLFVLACLLCGGWCNSMQNHWCYNRGVLG